MKRIFIWALKSMRKAAKATNWICQSSCSYSLFHILQEVGPEKNSVHLRLACLLHTHIHTHRYTYMYVYVYTYTYTYTCVYVYTMWRYALPTYSLRKPWFRMVFFKIEVFVLVVCGLMWLQKWIAKRHVFKRDYQYMLQIL